MLIRIAVQKRIKQGEVTLAFRRRRKLSVKAGGNLNTSVGLLAIHTVDLITEDEISDHEAKQAGYARRDDLIEDLAGREGELYRISLAYAGEDPRIKLRETEDLTTEESDDIIRRLQRFDAASRAGAWTNRTLAIIRDHPELRSADLAKKTGFEQAELKINVRKLKKLGLTISMEVG